MKRLEDALFGTPTDSGVTPHTTLIPSIDKRLPVKPHQQQLINNIREALGISSFIHDEQINYQLSWCKWMATEGHSSRFAKIQGVKDHLYEQFLSDEGIANAIRAAERALSDRGTGSEEV